MSVIDGASVFAVGVRSDNNYGKAAERAINAKSADVFAASPLMFWDVNSVRIDVMHSFRTDAAVF
jgi:hypothetical protein